MSEAKVSSDDIEMVFQRLRALPGNKVSALFKTVFITKYCYLDSFKQYLLALLIFGLACCSEGNLKI